MRCLRVNGESLDFILFDKTLSKLFTGLHESILFV